MKTKKTILALITLCSCLVLSACNHGTSTSSESSSNSTSSSTTNKGTSTTSSSSGGDTSTGTSSNGGGTSTGTSSTVPPVVYHTVTFKNYDGTILLDNVQVKDGEHTSYTGALPTRAADETYKYSFNGWDRDPLTTVINADTTFTATYAIVKLETSGLIFDINEDGVSCSVIDYIGGDTDVTIPAEHDDIPVTQIAKDVFSESSIKSVVIPSSVVIINDGAFDTCSFLSNVTFKEGLQVIDDGTFYDCPLLKSITLPDSVTYIGSQSFDGCPDDTSISVGDNISHIDGEAFGESNAQILAETSGGACYLKSRGGKYYAMSVDSSFTGSSVALKDDTICIGDNAFNCNTTITSITNTNKVKYIGSFAFRKTKISSLTSLDSLETIGEEAFSDSTSLSSISFGSSLKSVGSMAFDGCTNLNTITAVDLSSVDNLETAAFAGTGYTSNILKTEDEAYLVDTKNGAKVLVDTKDTLTSLTTDEKTIFVGNLDVLTNRTTGLTDITLTKDVKYIDVSYLGGLDNTPLESVTVEAGSKYYSADDKALYNADKTKMILYFADNTDTTLTIPASVTEIGENVCYNNTTITKLAFEDDSACVSIDDGAFYNCTALADITFPNKLVHIGDKCFYAMTDDVVTFPDSLVSVGYGSFTLCSKLTSVSLGSSFAHINVGPSGGRYPSAFEGDEALTTISFDDDSKILFVPEQSFFDCIRLNTVTIPDSIEYIDDEAFATEALANINISKTNSYFTLSNHLLISNISNTIVLMAYASLGTEITILSCVTSLEEGQFSECDTLTSISFETGSKITEIPESCFDGCASLSTFTIPDGVVSIGDRAFADCTSLTSVVIPSNVTSLGDSCFSGCTKLASVTIGSNAKLTSIGENAFYMDTALTSFTLSDSVTSIGADAFNGCTKLATVTISTNSKLVSLGARAFAYSGITSIYLPTSLATVGANIFSGCTNAITVTLASGINKTGWDSTWNTGLGTGGSVSEITA